MGYGVPLNIWIPSSMAGIFHDFSWWNWWLTWLDLCVPYFQTKIGTKIRWRDAPRALNLWSPSNVWSSTKEHGRNGAGTFNGDRSRLWILDHFEIELIWIYDVYLITYTHILVCVYLSIYFFMCVHCVCLYYLYIPHPAKWKMIICQWPFQEPKLEVPTIYKAYIRPKGLCPHKIWPYMVQYLHFRILELPLK